VRLGLVDLVETFVPSTQLPPRRLVLRHTQKTRAAYDTFYFALALREDALLTLDGTSKRSPPRRRPRRL